MAEPKTRSIFRRKKKLIVFLVLLGVILAITIFVLTSEPEITIDYVAELNELTKPVGFTPEKNAARYYNKASDLFYDMPQEVKKAIYLSQLGVRRINWSTDRHLACLFVECMYP